MSERRKKVSDDAIVQAMIDVGGNQRGAATLLGIARNALQKRLRKMGDRAPLSLPVGRPRKLTEKRNP